MRKKRLLMVVGVVLTFLLIVVMAVAPPPPPPPTPGLPGESIGQQVTDATDVEQESVSRSPARLSSQRPARQQPSSVEQQLPALELRVQYLESTAGKFSTPVMVLLAVNMILVGLIIYFLIITRPRQPSYGQ